MAHAGSNTRPVFHDRVAVVTGASSGIGAATARTLAAGGARVALLARRLGALERVVDEIRQAGGDATAVAVDVTDAASVDAAAAAVRNAYGPTNLLFNNAGIMLPGAIDSPEPDGWEQQLDVNITGAMRVAQAFIPHLGAEAAAGRQTDLINTSSIAAQYIYPYFAVYSATKAYVSHLTRHMRVELGPKNIRVSMIEPGIVATELQGHWRFQGAKDWLANAAKDVEFLQPEDVAEAVAFLASRPARVNLQQLVIMPTRQGT